MAKINEVNKGDIIDFQLVQNGIHGDDRVGVKVVGIVTYEVARSIDTELYQKHVALFPYFRDKVGDVDDVTRYDFILVSDVEGGIEVIGTPWVNESTLKIIDGRNAYININNWREEFRAPVLTFLAGLGASYTMNVSDK